MIFATIFPGCIHAKNNCDILPKPETGFRSVSPRARTLKNVWVHRPKEYWINAPDDAKYASKNESKGRRPWFDTIMAKHDPHKNNTNENTNSNTRQYPGHRDKPIFRFCFMGIDIIFIDSLVVFSLLGNEVVDVVDNHGQ
jgi:hypothetical protein